MRYLFALIVLFVLTFSVNAQQCICGPGCPCGPSCVCGPACVCFFGDDDGPAEKAMLDAMRLSIRKISNAAEYEEQVNYFNLYQQAVAKRVPLMVGVGCNVPEGAYLSCSVSSLGNIQPGTIAVLTFNNSYTCVNKKLNADTATVAQIQDAFAVQNQVVYQQPQQVMYYSQPMMGGGGSCGPGGCGGSSGVSFGFRPMMGGFGGGSCGPGGCR